MLCNEYPQSFSGRQQQTFTECTVCGIQDLGYAHVRCLPPLTHPGLASGQLTRGDQADQPRHILAMTMEVKNSKANGEQGLWKLLFASTCQLPVGQSKSHSQVKSQVRGSSTIPGERLWVGKGKKICHNYKTSSLPTATSVSTSALDPAPPSAPPSVTFMLWFLNTTTALSTINLSEISLFNH